MSTYLNKQFYALLREGRAARGLSQKELAIASSVNLRTVQKLELGMRPPTPESVRKLADGLKCSADFLLGRIVWTDEEFVSNVPKKETP